MLRNNKLLIDKDCPMCTIYGNCFSKMRLVDDKTIVHYQTAGESIFSQIDQERAKSEVALIDCDTGVTVYGATAFMKILAGERKLLKTLFNFPPLRFLSHKLYQFISFNRHIITGNVSTSGTERDCTPPVHKVYRWAFILITAIFTGFMVNQFALLLDVSLAHTHDPWREYLICFGQIVWQFLALTLINSERRLDYLGNMSTISLVGALLLIPLMGLNFVFPLNTIVLLMSFFGIVGIMLLMHIRRCKRLGLQLLVSISWVFFRAIVLIIVLLNL